MPRFQIKTLNGEVVIFDAKRGKVVLKDLTTEPAFVEFVVTLLNHNCSQ